MHIETVRNQYWQQIVDGCQPFLLTESASAATTPPNWQVRAQRIAMLRSCLAKHVPIASVDWVAEREIIAHPSRVTEQAAKDLFERIRSNIVRAFAVARNQSYANARAVTELTETTRSWRS